MKRHRALAWLITLLLVSGLLGPTVGRAAAQDDSATAASAVIATETASGDGRVITGEQPTSEPVSSDPAVPTEPTPDESIAPVDEPGADQPAEPTGAPAADEATAGGAEPAAEVVPPRDGVDAPATAEALPTAPAASAGGLEPADLDPVGSIAFTNVDDRGQPLAGAQFGIAAGGCPATVFTVTRTTVADGIVTFTDLPLPGGADTTFCVTEIAPPPGYTGAETDRPYVLTANVPAVTGPDWVNTPLPGSITVYVRDTTGAAAPDGGFTLLDETCAIPVPGTAEQFAVDTGNPLGAETTFAGLAVGTYCVKATTVPPAYTPVSPVAQTVTLGPGQDGVVTVTVEFVTGTVTLMKAACIDMVAPAVEVSYPSGAWEPLPDRCAFVPGTKHVSILRYGDLGGTAIDASFDGDVAERAEPLTLGRPHTITDTETSVSGQFEVSAGQETVIRFLMPVSALGTGSIEASWLFCPIDITATSGILIDPRPDQIPEGCQKGSLDFDFYPFSGSQRVTLADGGSGPVTFDGIPANPSPLPPHRITDYETGFSTTFRVEMGATTVLTVVKYRLHLSLFIAKFRCETDAAEHDAVTFEVLQRVRTVEEIDIGVPDGCRRDDASFLVYSSWDTDRDPIPVTTAGGVALVEGLPAEEADETGALLVEQETGASIKLTLCCHDSITPVIVTNWATRNTDDDSGGGAGTGEREVVTTLPNTGTGAPNAPPITGLLALIALVAAARLRRLRAI